MDRRKFLVALAASTVASASVARAAGSKVVRVWHTFNRDYDMIHLGMKLFNESQSTYVIEPRLIPYVQLNPELVRAIATGSPPDLVLINGPDIAGYASQDRLMDITDLVASSKLIGAQDFQTGPDKADHWRGRRYSVAREMNSLSLYINEDMMLKKGLDPERPPTTWSQLQAAAEKLTDPAAKVNGFGFCAHGSEQATFQFQPWLIQAGGAINKLDAPAATAALQFLTDLVTRGIVSRDVINQQQLEVINTFIAGNTAIAVGGPWELPRMVEAKFKWRVAPLPVKGDVGVEASSLGGFHFAIPVGAREPEGAMLIIERMMSTEVFQQGWNTSGILAPKKNIVISSPNWPQAYDVFSHQMKTAVQRGPHPQWASISRPLQTAIQEALTGTKTPKDALAGAAAKIEPILAKTPL